MAIVAIVITAVYMIFAAQLMGFFVEVDGDDTIRLDENELQVAKWCSREEIPENDGISLTREMMEVFKNGKV